MPNLPQNAMIRGTITQMSIRVCFLENVLWGRSDWTAIKRASETNTTVTEHEPVLILPGIDRY